MAIIQDAATGKTARVDDSNRLRTFTVVQEADKQANLQGYYYSISFDVTPLNANSYFFYLQNTGIFDLTITDFRTYATVPTVINIRKVTGTPSYVSATAAQITNRNLGSSNAPTVIANFDTNITNLTAAGRLFFQSLDTANRMESLRTTSTIIIPQGQAIAMQRVAATGTVSCIISLSREIDL